MAEQKREFMPMAHRGEGLIRIRPLCDIHIYESLTTKGRDNIQNIEGGDNLITMEKSCTMKMQS
ncbi:MAG: hypothetical protein KJ739_09835 [Nitrospinae bacterium]|nr:hypothetical protein [Nitrospinota bacterium]